MGQQARVERFVVCKFTNPGGTTAWRVSGTELKGARIRENYRTKAEALKRKGDLELASAEVATSTRLVSTWLNDSQLADAEASVHQAGNMPLGKVLGQYQRWVEVAAAKGVSVDAALRFFSANYRYELEELTIFNAVSRFLESRRALGLEPTTLATYSNTLRLLYRGNPNKLVGQYSVRDISDLLARYTRLTSKRSLLGRLSTFFRWAVRFHHALENPCDRLDKLPPETSKIAILDLASSARLLHAAREFQKGKMLPVVTIALFAGLRPSEIRDLTPADFRNGQIRVRGGKLRRTTNRMVPIPPNLQAWLERHPFTRFPAGYPYALRRLKEASGAKVWVNDIMRHTSISFQIEREKNDALVALNCGTSLAMINRHYREVVEDADEVAKYWALAPDTLDAAVKEPPTIKKPKRAKWPPDKELAHLVSTLSILEVGRRLGVSDNAVRKRCRARGIVFPTRGMERAVGVAEGA